MDSASVQDIRDTVRPALLQMLQLAEEKGLERLQWEQEGLHISLARRLGPVEEDLAAPPAAQVSVSSPQEPSEDQEDSQEARMLPVRSTLVGIFRSSVLPGAAAPVKVGARVEAGQVLAWVESMRLMYEVKAPEAGRLAEVLVDEGLPVEYGQPLIVLEIP